MLVTNEIAEVYFRLLGTNGFHVKAEDKNLPLRACVVVRTSSMKISRRHLADNVKKLHKKRVPHMRTIIFFHSTNQIIGLCCCSCCCCTCCTIMFPHSTNQIIDLWRCCCRCRCRIYPDKKQLVNKPLSAAGISEDNAQSRKIVRKMNS